MCFSIRPLQEAHTEAAARLWRAEFGAPEDTVRSWLKAVVTPRFATSGFVALPNETSGDASSDAIAGFGITEIGRRQYTREYLGLDALNLDLTLDVQNGIFHLCVVAPAWRRRGIATALYNRRLAHLEGQGIRRIVGISWNRTHAPDSRVLFDAHGFRQVAVVERFYARTLPRKHCPDCNGPCQCTASIHVRDACPPREPP